MTLQGATTASRVPCQDLERARRWYAEKLGLEPVEERPGGLRYLPGGSAAGGEFVLYASAGASDGSFTQMGFNVDDLRATKAELEGRGVVFEEYPGLTGDDGIAVIEGQYPSKGTGELGAWFRDSEGNLLGVGQITR